jgi:uncharacterized protein YgiM (DUF1202 family)
MQNKTTIYWIGGFVLVLGGIIIALRAIKQSQERAKLDGNAPPPPRTDQSVAAEPPVAGGDGYTKLVDNVTQGIVNAVKNITGRYMKYRVATKDTALNVRQKPTEYARVVSKLPKGGTIFARTTSNIGWLEVSVDGQKPIGFVSSTFLKYEG